MTRERRSISYRALGLGALALLAVLGLGVWLAYREFLHYEARASLHLPRDPRLGIRIDVEQVVMFESVRKRLLPLLEELPNAQSTRPASETGSRMRRLREQADLNLGLDLREVAVARLAGGEGWLFALGGLFPKRGVVAGIDAVLGGEGMEGLLRDGSTLGHTPSGWALGQANDGVLVLASSRPLLERALAADESTGNTELAALGPLALTANLRDWKPGVESVVIPWLANLERLQLGSRFGGEHDLEIVLRLALAPGFPPQRVASDLESWRSSSLLMATLGLWAESGLFAVLQRAKIEPVGSDGVQLSTFCTREELDRAALAVAQWVRLASATGG